VAAKEPLKTITTEELKNKIDLNQKFSLINVLPKEIFDSKHIPGSINIPNGKVATSTSSPKDKSDPLILD
jgi:rhodanese-related sulfurtransferase